MTDADRLNDYLETARERYNRESVPFVVMCGCANWTVCDHPWPMVVERLSYDELLAPILAKN